MKPLEQAEVEEILREDRESIERTFTFRDSLYGTVSVIIRKDGRAGLVGRGEVLNFICDQAPHCRNLWGDDSLPNGAVIYAIDRQMQDNEHAPIFSNNARITAAAAA